MIAVFIYNILLLMLYTVTLALVVNQFRSDKRQLYMLVGVYLLFFIFDNTIIYMTEFINSFAATYNQTFMSIPAAKTIIYLVNGYCSLQIVNVLCQQKMPKHQFVLLGALGCWLLCNPLLTDSAIKVWLFYLPNQLLMLYLGVYLLKKLANKPATLPPQTQKLLKQIALISIIAGICILIEDTFVIFRVDQYTALSVKMYNRNVSEDIFSMVICTLILKTLLAKPETEKEQLESRNHIFMDFCQHYGFTERETEIFQLLLEHKTNQQIADEIYLSLGTVKTHVHNIFIKLDIKKRNQIFPIYEKYQAESAEAPEFL